MVYATSAPFIAAGAVAGALYFLLLYRMVRLHSAGVGAARVLPLTVARLASAGLFFWLVAREGAVPLLFALAGFLLARGVVQHLVRRA